jgi:Cu/Ag efflux protein CusF
MYASNSTYPAVIAFVCILALAGAAFAQARVKEKVNIAVTGDITELDSEARTITIKSTNDDGISYQVDGSATIMKGAQNLALGDLKTGWNVAANGHQTGDTRLLTLIKVVKAP